MQLLPESLPPPCPPLLGSLRSVQDQHGVREPLMPLSFDWGIPARTAAGREEVWGQAAEGKGCGQRLREEAEAVRTAATEMCAFARKDPRKPVFAAKVATALAFTTLLVFFREPRDIASHSIWAILTVVVVFEFSIGATLSKGMNRGLGTVTAGGLALAVAELATQMGKYDMLFFIISNFVVAFGATLAKLHPKMKPYEYGLRVFLLTFCIVTTSGYKEGNFTSMAISRFVLIAIGAAISLSVNIGIYPIWAGEDLHNLVANNFSGVAKSLEGCVDGYLRYMEYESVPSKILTFQASDEDQLYSGYMAAVQASAQEETLLGFAVWEPPHGPYKMMKYPWRSYTKVSGALRHCSFSVMALHGCILSEIQAPAESRKVFSAELHKVGQEGAKVLRELGHKVKMMTKLSSSNILAEVHLVTEELQNKIDEKSYLFVNKERWEARRRHERTEQTPDGADAADKDNKDERPEHTIVNIGAAHTSSSLFTPQSSGPATNSFHPSLPFEVVLSRTYGSASALSLATFASILIEFVARLQNLVDAFEELSEKANFEDPVQEPSEISMDT